VHCVTPQQRDNRPANIARSTRRAVMCLGVRHTRVVVIPFRISCLQQSDLHLDVRTFVELCRRAGFLLAIAPHFAIDHPAFSPMEVVFVRINAACGNPHRRVR